MGKDYASRKPAKERPESDNYSTPISLVWKLDILNIVDKLLPVFDCCSGEGNIVKSLRKCGYDVTGKDIRKNKGYDYLKHETKYPQIVSNFPFSLWDRFLVHAIKQKTELIVTIGKVNFFGAHRRNKCGLWDYLESGYVFDRQIDYRTPYREDGSFCVGNLITGWFVFRCYHKKYETQLNIIDVQKYATLGSYESYMKRIIK